MNKFPVVVVDAFTEKAFGGNPAAVCVLATKMPADSVLKLIAAEMNLSETGLCSLLIESSRDFLTPRCVVAFAEPIDAANGEYRLRWFTPTAEVSLCGHATLATGLLCAAHSCC